LLAEAAGILLGGQHQPEQDSQAGAAAGLCVKAGADVNLIAEWAEVGRKRVRDAGVPPFGMKVLPQRRGDE
jgi:hypothetical protein